jgi:hypothetical protein
MESLIPWSSVGFMNIVLYGTQKDSSPDAFKQKTCHYNLNFLQFFCSCATKSMHAMALALVAIHDPI